MPSSSLCRLFHGYGTTARIFSPLDLPSSRTEENEVGSTGLSSHRPASASPNFAVFVATLM